MGTEKRIDVNKGLGEGGGDFSFKDYIVHI